MAPRRRIRTRGFTLLEMVVTVVIIGILTGFSAGILSPQISFWRGRTTAQSVVTLLKHAQYLARTTHINRNSGDDRIGPRGFLPNSNPVPVYGVSIFQPPGQGRGFSLLLWRGNDGQGGFPPDSVGDPDLCIQRPGALANFASLTGAQRGYLIEMPMETVITRQASLTPTPLADTRISFGPDGRVDAANSDIGNLVEDPYGGLEFRTWSFDIMNPDIGYMRVRIHADGTVEQSMAAPVGGPLLTQGGAPF